MIFYEPIFNLNPNLTNEISTPLNVANYPPEWREFFILTQIYKDKLWEKDDYVGLISPKFEIKTGIKLKEFKKFIKKNKDYDLYFINPFPHIQYLYLNVWKQGETYHPNITNIADKLLKEANVNIEINMIKRTNNNINSFCNFWVGNSLFWEKYVGQILIPIRKFIENHPENKVVIESLKITTHTSPAPYLPFIVERLLTSFLYYNKEIKFTHFPTEDNLEKYFINDIDKVIVANLKDIIHRMDLNSGFNQENITFINQIGMLRGIYDINFFMNNNHPHSGNRIFIANEKEG